MASKFVLKSKTYLGGIVAALPVLAPMFGIGADDVHLIGQAADNAMSLLGLAAVFYGRHKAGGVHFFDSK